MESSSVGPQRCRSRRRRRRCVQRCVIAAIALARWACWLVATFAGCETNGVPPRRRFAITRRSWRAWRSCWRTVEPIEVTVEDLREVIDLWAEREARTRQKVTSVVRAFWSWAEEQDHVPFSPATKLRRPRAPRKTAPLLPADADARLLGACGRARDRVGLLLLLDLGLRRTELAGVQVRDVDLARRELMVFGKGQKARTLPLRGRVVLELEAWSMTPLKLHDRTPEPDDFLLYPEKRTAGGRLLAAYPKRRLQPTSMHRWWYQRCADAGLVGDGVTAGLNMHRARHTFATEMRRVAGIDAASHALGHADLNTTLSIYGHRDLSDLESAMEALARSRRH